jgi:hypothetical protein
MLYIVLDTIYAMPHSTAFDVEYSQSHSLVVIQNEDAMAN